MSVVGSVARHLMGRDVGHPLRVGVDGICGAGKSTFARELVATISSLGGPAIHLDSDGFHHVRERRHRQGRGSARGYYEDAYDFDALADRVLRPLGPGGNRVHATRVHDLHTDDVVILDETARAPRDAVVVFDATFIQRDQLRSLWDEVIYLRAEESVATARGVARDAAVLGGPEAARSAFETRYMAACRLYLDEQVPAAQASIVLDNNDPSAPRLVRPSELGPYE
ncbi:uridine kinase [Aeromicrobium sp. CTD01-1L150]|uniref:uridine kinase n=1 Tax=Aeromicrobium sp. CTD01-1L150 TaxID=3341830 RepID=UPI0035C26947